MSDDGSHLAVLAEPMRIMCVLEQISKLYGVGLHKAEVPMTYDEIKLYYFAMEPEWRMPTPVDIEAMPEINSYYNIWIDGDIVQEALKYTRPLIKRTLILIKTVDSNIKLD